MSTIYLLIHFLNKVFVIIEIKYHRIKQ